MKYKCIIFDCDGILVDSEAISNATLIQMAKEVGAVIDEEFAIDNFSGNALKNCIALIEEMVGKPLPANFEEEFRSRSFASFESDLKPIQGIHDLLEQIKIPYCVASSGPVNKIRLNLTTTNLIEKFEGKIFSCYQIGRWKPDPAIFIHAAKVMGFNPKDCAVIEDSLHGIKAGISGGFDVYGFATAKNKEAFEKQGAKVFYEMNKLYKLLSQ